MSYPGAGLVLLAVLAGTGHLSPSPLPTAVPESVSASPVLTENASGTWSTTVVLNTAALCTSGKEASFSLATTSPDAHTTDVSATTDLSVLNHQGCKLTPKAWEALVTSHPLTQVTLSFGPGNGFPTTPPVTAAVVITPSTPSASPVQVTVAVHRWVSWLQYLWVPVWCGLGLGLLFLTATLLFGLRDPDNGQIRGRKILNRPLYAGSAWTFSGSWATNVTAAGAVAAAVLTATETVSEVLPGVETGRFSLLIIGAGAITAIAPLLFGALNYNSLQADPTTTGVSVVTLPPGSSMFLIDPPGDDTGLARETTVLPTADIAVPAGATMTLSGGGRTGNGKTGKPGSQRADVTLLPGATLTVPPGATIKVATTTAESREVLALPGTTDIVVLDGQQVKITQPVTVAAKDVSSKRRSSPPRHAPRKSSYTLRREQSLALQGQAKISFLGQARLRLPAGTSISAPNEEGPVKPAPLRAATSFVLPRSAEVVASRMWPLLLASVLTLFGTGAELGILGVLACWLSSAESAVRWVSGALLGVTALVVLYYGVVSIKALADPTPGDALNAAGGSSFIL
jgi:hypothetical protein